MARALESILNPSRHSPLDGGQLPVAVALMAIGIGASAQTPAPDPAAASPAQAAATAAQAPAAGAAEVAIERISLAPDHVRPGDTIEITMQYRVTPPPGTAEVAVTESWSLRDGNREVASCHPASEERAPSDWVTRATLHVPRDAIPGPYAILHRVATASSRDQRSTDFVIEPRIVPPEVSDWLAQGRAALAAKRLLTPEDDAAVTYTRRVLDVDPGNPEALTLIAEVIDTYLGWADAQIGRYSLANARSNLSKAQSLDAHASLDQRERYQALQRQLRARQSQATANQRQTTRTASGKEEGKGFFGAMKRQLKSADCTIQGLIDPGYCK
ncbi:hypothetical protein Thimo_0839 [Thioflavicoccus mobilis 8321]|uniref:Uncharacterized protein n=1 Tax=Thioflavicoccus mobilis 8321 TaxID=765912 RepID=L0GWC4_9GAMM|nr:hypothetical protein [Thioflavicoccus mobilis]AGA89675.1 hypothetical protein Thimo_0839 [Thioflavicoccus mobilis 8321]